MPATVLAERVGWDGSIRWFSDNVKRLRPEHRPIDPADRLTWAAGDAAQCDLWFPPRKIPLEDGTAKLLPVLVITAAHSRFMTGRMIPTRKTEDLLLGSWELIQQLGRVPRRLIWDNEPGIGRGQRRAEGGRGRSWGTLATKLVLLPPNDPESKGLVERRNGWFETSFMPGRYVQLAGGLQHPVQRLAGQGERPGGPHDQGCTGRPGRGRPGCDVAVAADPAASGLAQQDPVGSRLLRPARHQRLLRRPDLIGRMVDVAADLERVRVRAEGRIVAEHVRVWARGTTVTDPVHVETAGWLRKQFQQPRAARCRG